jgi:hypothetical protein
MRTQLQQVIRCLLLPAVMALNSTGSWAAQDARVFPVKAFFYDDTKDSKLDSRFRDQVKATTQVVLAAKVHQALEQQLKEKVGELNRNTAGRTFTVSFHVTRATSFSVEKGNGNADILASVTAALYFTNVMTGEILTTISRSMVSRAVVPSNGGMDAEKNKLFTQALDTLIVDLAEAASKSFSPVVVETTVMDQVGDLLVLDAGYAKGVQSGDSLNDISGQLLEVVYAGQHYSVAQRILADKVTSGSVFHKYLSRAADGKIRPRTVVLVESLPANYSDNYIAQLFSELVGDTAPLTMVQVNPGFSDLLSKVVQQATLGSHDTARREIPDLFIRLRVAEPVMYEAKTNLAFETTRHYQTLAFADVVDPSGRVNFSVVGKDEISDKISSGIGAGFAERREVSIKNALTDLAQKLAELSELQRDQSEVVASTSEDAHVNSLGKTFSSKQKGVLLRKAKVRFGKDNQQLLIPVTEAFVESGGGSGQTRLGLGLPLDTKSDKVSPGDVFEIQRLGPLPRSAQAFAVCGPVESLGNINTSSFLEMTGNALGQRMPGVMYVPEIVNLAKHIGPINNFKRSVKWDIPPVGICIQPVERVNGSEDQCSTQCERQITARYTLRIKSGTEILSRVGFESQFKSTGFYKQIEPQHLKSLIDADLIDEAKTLLDKAADKVVFPQPMS